MGLGPLICPECLVYARDMQTNEWGAYKWTCPGCGNDQALEYLWMFTEEQQKKIEINTKFYNFVLGET